MKVKFLIMMMAIAMCSTILTGCNLDGDNDEQQQENINYEPTRYNDDNRERPGNDVNENFRERDGFEDRQRQDGPFDMDEEEPDLDEEPSEERRGD
ncbi:hypothetical protein [Halobacillus seohaensis]|uniref:Lipoprotein n=1 Tax=Halobacillus seohaensis TaxID=447421 RepID=A0ABW2EH92_9BACI